MSPKHKKGSHSDSDGENMGRITSIRNHNGSKRSPSHKHAHPAHGIVRSNGQATTLYLNDLFHPQSAQLSYLVHRQIFNTLPLHWKKGRKRRRREEEKNMVATRGGGSHGLAAEDDIGSAEEQVNAQQQQAHAEEQTEQEDNKAPQHPLNDLNNTVQALT